MSNEAMVEYIKSKQCAKCSDIGLCAGCAVLIALKLIKDAPAVPQEMSAREYHKSWKRMCATNISVEGGCSFCPLCTDDSGYLPCGQWTTPHPDEAVAIVEKWAADHSAKDINVPTKCKTYAEDFKEKFPNAEMRSNETDIPIVCRRTCYGKIGKDKCTKSWNGFDDCVACWHMEME